ncbi:MAG: hypothetical protein KDB57_03370 [Solirubrobacterales bacterium]|nr:hypothetical protein [Solirubrobacterales bacterium]
MEQENKVNYAGAIYGTVISMTVIATSSKDASLDPMEIAGWAATTAIVFWLAHVYADIVAAGYSTVREALGHARAAFRAEWPIVQGAMIPVVAMLAAPLGLVSDEDVSFFAVCTGIVVLFATGLLVGSRDGRSWARRLLVGAINALFGVVILALKIFVH